MLRRVHAARYVLPLREGSSVPALVEGDDLGMYVVKLRGAGQGPKALIAETITGELARAAGFQVPEIVAVDLDRALALSEPDPELCAPLEASAGVNVGLDFLPGSITFDPIVGPAPDAASASRLVLFDAFVTNVDRTAKNPNLLHWHGRLWLIDHGASLYFHHGWRATDATAGSDDPFREVRAHVLLRWASELGEAKAHLRATLTDEAIEHAVSAIPGALLEADRTGDFDDETAHRTAYVAWLRARVAALDVIHEEAARAHAERV